MDLETRQKIEETVLDILKNANLEEITVFKVLITASERLGFDLSNSEHKSFVRSVVDKFLLSSATEAKDVVHEEQQELKVKDEDRLICKLSRKRSVLVQDFRGIPLVTIREFYGKDGQQFPSTKGISMTTQQWSAFKKNVPAIEEAIKKMESKLRSQCGGKQSEEKKHNEDAPNALADVPPQELVPIEINRFDGKNYHDWVQQMEILLKQLNIAYVLVEPCPSTSLYPEASTKVNSLAKATEQKWKNDDYICRHNVLNSLSDQLYHLYSKKTSTAKELWEELKLVNLCEEFKTKRSQVKKYMEYQMVEERSIVEQVQDINNIADSVVASGMTIEEKFHVSVIISKLPPSWKAVSIKLMCEEYLPFPTLMHRLTVEEQLRNQEKPRMPTTIGHQTNGKLLPKKGSMKAQNIFCDYCGRKGHLSQHCWNKKAHRGIIERRDELNVSMPATVVNMVDGAVE